MTSTTQPQPTHGANREATDEHLSERVLIREARKVVVDLRLGICGSRIKKIVRRFVDEGRSDIDLRTYLLGYADPTGETAARNIDREQHGRWGE